MRHFEQVVPVGSTILIITEDDEIAIRTLAEESERDEDDDDIDEPPTYGSLFIDQSKIRAIAVLPPSVDVVAATKFIRQEGFERFAEGATTKSLDFEGVNLFVVPRPTDG